LTRHVLVLLGGFLAGSRLVDAARAWQEWHRWAVADPSAADLYRTNFWLDVVVALLTLAAAWPVHRLLRPRDEST
jgi:hypothetical protein